MEKEIARMEADEHIHLVEKAKMAAEIRMKQAIIDAQASEMAKLRSDFATKAKEAQDNADKFKNMLDGLQEKV